MAITYTNSEFEDILIYFTHSILGQNTEEEIAWDLAKNCISKLGFEDCVVYFLDESCKMLVQKAAYGPKNPRHYEIADPILIPLGQGITGTVALNAKSALVGDTSLDERYIVDDEIRYSEISVPVVVNGKVFGVIDCEHQDKNFFTEQHLKILEAIASIYSIKISKVRAERISKEKAQSLLNVQQELLTLKVKALRTQMNPHFLFNAINAIQYFITVGDKRSALMFLTTFSKLIRYYLNHFEKEEVEVEAELQLLQWYFDLQKMRYTDKFDYVMTARMETTCANLKIPSMVLGPFTEYILESAVFENQLKGKVKLKIRLAGEELHITAIVVSSASEHSRRFVNYREKMTPWEEQIDYLNRLKGCDIKKMINSRYIAKKNLKIERFVVIIPTHQ